MVWRAGEVDPLQRCFWTRQPAHRKSALSFHTSTNRRFTPANKMSGSLVEDRTVAYIETVPWPVESLSPVTRI